MEKTNAGTSLSNLWKDCWVPKLLMKTARLGTRSFLGREMEVEKIFSKGWYIHWYTVLCCVWCCKTFHMIVFFLDSFWPIYIQKWQAETWNKIIIIIINQYERKKGTGVAQPPVATKLNYKHIPYNDKTKPNTLFHMINSLILKH